MTRRIRATFLPVVLTTGLVLGGCSGAALASWHGDHRTKELAALDAAKTSAEQAIAIVQTQTGGHAMRGAFDRERDRYVYRVKTIDEGGKVMWGLVDATSGKIAGMYQEGILYRLTDGEDRLAFARLSPSATSLDAAIATARKVSAGKVLTAVFSDEGGHQTYIIRVAEGDRISRLRIDPVTGSLVKKAGRDD